MELSSLLSSTLSIIPELVLVVTSLVIILIGTIKNENISTYNFFISVLCICLVFVLNLSRFTEPSVAFSGALSLDVFSAYFNAIFLIGAFFTILISRDYMEQNENISEYFALILLSTSGMMFIASAIEFMSLFIGFEIMSIAVYILSGFNKKSVQSTESGIKYLVLGGFSSAILLFGIALLYGATGSIYFKDIISAFDYKSILYVTGSIMVLTGFLFKIGAAPLHQWVPDIYEGAPTPITAFMSVAVKAAGFAILLRVLFEGVNITHHGVSTAILIVSILTMTVGNISAITQRSIKRMLAYSSIAHAGYALIGIIAQLNGEPNALSGVLYYLYAYTLMNMGAFAILCYLSRENRSFNDYEQISGLWQRKPYTAICLAIFMFSLAGIPPTIGFFAKYRIFLSAVEAQLYLLAVIGIINSVISAYYYLRVLVYAFMHKEQFTFEPYKPISVMSIVILSIGTLLFGLFPLYSIELAIKAANTF